MDVVPPRSHLVWAQVRVENPDPTAWPETAGPTTWHSSVTTVAAATVAAVAGCIAWQVGPSWWWIVLAPVVLFALLVALAWAAPDPASTPVDEQPLATRRGYLILGRDLGSTSPAPRNALAVALAAHHHSARGGDVGA